MADNPNTTNKGLSFPALYAQLSMFTTTLQKQADRDEINDKLYCSTRNAIAQIKTTISYVTTEARRHQVESFERIFDKATEVLKRKAAELAAGKTILLDSRRLYRESFTIGDKTFQACVEEGERDGTPLYQLELLCSIGFGKDIMAVEQRAHRFTGAKVSTAEERVRVVLSKNSGIVDVYADRTYYHARASRSPEFPESVINGAKRNLGAILGVLFPDS